MNRIAVLMTCHNRKDKTLRCLVGLLPQLTESDLVFLADDGSVDGTAEAVENLDRKIRIVKGDGSLFWAKGMRLAWDAAEKSGPFDFVLWLNDDVELYDNALESSFKDWESIGDESAVLVGACEFGGECTYSATDAKDQKIIPNGSPQLASGWFNGNFVLIPRTAYEKVGKICSDYSHARADYDYAERLKVAGIPFYVASRNAGKCKSDFDAKIRKMGFFRRIASLWRPGYFNLRDLYLIRSRYHGHLRAILSCLRLVQIVITGVK